MKNLIILCAIVALMGGVLMPLLDGERRTIEDDGLGEATPALVKNPHHRPPPKMGPIYHGEGPAVPARPGPPPD